MSSTIVGLDFDNTIVSYDALFAKVAREQGIQVAATASKNEVRDQLHALGRDDAWTEMQGYVYGARMSEAVPFPGALESIARLVANGLSVFIVSHRTLHPYRGPAYDLHHSARQWLEDHRFFDVRGVSLQRDSVFFELSKQDKVARIHNLGCDHFVDDLPEILALIGADNRIRRILFDPQRQHRDTPGVHRVAAWNEICRALNIDAVNGGYAHARH